MFERLLGRTYLRVAAVQLEVDLLEAVDGRQVQGASHLTVGGQAEVPPPLDGQRHQVGAGELHGSVHVVWKGRSER